MLKIHWDKDELGIEIYGDNFEELKDTLKDYHFQYNPTWHYREHVWTKPKVPSAKRALFELRKIEDFPMTRAQAKMFEPTPETEKLDLEYNPDFLVGEPLGEYQKQGIISGITNSRFYYAWEMGLGKTYGVIGVLNHLWHYKVGDNVLILAPSESLFNFKVEILTFNTVGLKEEDVQVVMTSDENPFPSEAKILIMTYNTFKIFSHRKYTEKTGKTPTYKVKRSIRFRYRKPPLEIENWGKERILIADEAHLLKNRSTQWTVVARLHKDFFRFRYMLSGTPYPNGIEELYSQLEILDKGIIGEDYNTWLETVAELGDSWSEYSISGYKPDEIEKFVRRLKPWMSREFAEHNLELPPLHEKKIYFDLSEKQRKLFQELATLTLRMVKEEKGRLTAREVENKFPFLLQAVEDPCRLKGKIDPLLSPKLHKMVEKWKFKDNSRLFSCDALLERYIKEDKHKTILWSGHPETMDRLAEYYKKYNPIVIHGQTVAPKGVDLKLHRHNLLETFKHDPKHKLLIASYVVLNSAVNIVQAPRAIYFDMSDNLVHMLQSLKRNHRKGQTQTCIANRLIGWKTLEMRKDRRLDKKTELNDGLTNLDSIPKEDWVKIFEGEEIFE